MSDELSSLLSLWEYQSPWHQDFTHVDEVFPSASYQYVLYGMGFKTQAPMTQRQSLNERVAQQHLQKNHQLTQKLVSGLPTNRELINSIRQHGLKVA
jgi:hypothetical protein